MTEHKIPQQNHRDNLRKGLQKKLQLCIFLTSYLLISPAAAFHEIEQTLFDMSLSDLLDIKVTTPSKFAQPLNETPAVITTFSKEEIALFGGRDLGEVLSRMPGLEEFASLINGRNVVTIRADQISTNNNHVLFLLDGVPLNRESYTGGIWNEAMILSIPLNIIHQLEVIRGPGSVLYGTNAFAGVVNIITQTSHELTDSVTVGTGSFNTKKVAIEFTGEINEWFWTSALRFSQTDGWPFTSKDSAGDTFKDHAYSQSPGIIATLKKHGFSASLFLGEAEQFTIRGSADLPEAGRTDNEKYMLDLAYMLPLSDRWMLTTHLSHVGGRTKHKVASPTPGQLLTINYETDDSRFEVSSRAELNDHSSLLVGATIDHFSGRTPPPLVIVPDWSNYLMGLYGQYEIKIDDTKFILGGQLNKPKENPSKFVPRMGVIHHLNDNSGVKLLYGQAFRSPYVVEREINVSIPNLTLKGDKNLKPELVTTWDLQYFYSDTELSYTATVFRNEQKDLIVRSPTGATSFVFANKGELVIQGIELESKYKIGHWYFTGSFTAQNNEDGNNLKDFTLQPRHIIKLGIGYTAGDWSVGVFDSYLAKYQENDHNIPQPAVLNPKSKATHRVSANIRYQPKQLQGWEFAVYLDNILDEEFYIPIPPGEPPPINTRNSLAERFVMFSVKMDY